MWALPPSWPVSLPPQPLSAKGTTTRTSRTLFTISPLITAAILIKKSLVRHSHPLPGPRRPQRPQHRPRCRRSVEGVEVNSGRAGDQQLRALLRRVSDAELELALRLAPGRREGGSQGRWNRRVAEVANPLRLRAAGDRDHPSQDRHLDPRRPRRPHEVEVDLVVEEELGDQKVGAGIDLRLQVAEIRIKVGRLRVHLRKAGAAD